MVLAGITCETDAAAGTMGVGGLPDLGEAGKADPGRKLFLRTIPAKGTTGREEKVGQSMPPEAHF